MHTNKKQKVHEAHNAIKISNPRALNAFAHTQGFTYRHEQTTAIEATLFFAPVALLAHQEQPLGVFSSQAISTGQAIGMFAGRRTSRLRETTSEDNANQFILDSGKGKTVTVIDATEERNWTSMVQPAASAMLANVHVTSVHPNIIYSATQDIAPGEQFLVSYDDMYNFNTPHVEGKRYLKPRDNWMNSENMLHTYESHYEHNKRYTLPHDLALFFDIAPTQPFVRLKISKTNLDVSTVDLPLLAYNNHNDQPQPQAQQENITQLMLYCWTGESFAVEMLLSNQANPNLQSSISGYSALHVLVASPLPFELKKTLIEYLMSYDASMILQDDEEESILHLAVRKKNPRLVTYLINKNKSHTSQDKPLLTDLINLHEQDAFLLAVAEGITNIINTLLLTLTLEDLTSYIENNTLRDACAQLQKNNAIPFDEKQTIRHNIRRVLRTSNLPEDTLDSPPAQSLTISSSMTSLFEEDAEDTACQTLLSFQSPTHDYANSQRFLRATRVPQNNRDDSNNRNDNNVT